jgi:hypothetical protein
MAVYHYNSVNELFKAIRRPQLRRELSRFLRSGDRDRMWQLGPRTVIFMRHLFCQFTISKHVISITVPERTTNE